MLHSHKHADTEMIWDEGKF